MENYPIVGHQEWPPQLSIPNHYLPVVCRLEDEENLPESSSTDL